MFDHGSLIRYVKLRIAHAPGMPGTFSRPPRVSDPDMHHGTCVTHVPWCMLGSLISSFLCSMWRGKRSRHSQRMRNPQFCVSGKRPMDEWLQAIQNCRCKHLFMTYVWYQVVDNKINKSNFVSMILQTIHIANWNMISWGNLYLRCNIFWQLSSDAQYVPNVADNGQE